MKHAYEFPTMLPFQVVTPSAGDLRYLKLDGSNANSDIDIGSYDFTALTGYFGDSYRTTIGDTTECLKSISPIGDAITIGSLTFSFKAIDEGGKYVTINTGTDAILSNGPITTTGPGTFGSTYQAILGDDGNSRAGSFVDGSNTVYLADGTNAITVPYGNVEIYQTLQANQLEMQIGNMLFIEQAAPYLGIGGSPSGSYLVEIFGSTSITDGSNYVEIMAGTYALTDGSNWFIGLDGSFYLGGVEGDNSGNLSANTLYYVGGIYDGSLLSIDPNSRYLYASDGSTVMLDWSTDGTLDAGDNAFTTTGTVTFGSTADGITFNDGSSHFHIYGKDANAYGTVDTGINFIGIDKPDYITDLAVVGAGNVDAGVHYYGIEYYTLWGSTGIKSYTSAPSITPGTDSEISMTIPVSPDYRVTGRRIYRSKAGVISYVQYLLVDIPNNVDTTYNDDISDADMDDSGIAYPYSYANSVLPFFLLDGVSAAKIGDGSTVFGVGANTAGSGVSIGNNAGANMLVSANQNTFVGANTGKAVTSGGGNTIVGGNAGILLTTSISNTIIGSQAMDQATGGSNNVIIGQAAMRYGTGSYNNIIGAQAYSSTWGNSARNIGIGYGIYGSMNNGGDGYNIAFGWTAGDIITTGKYNILLGADANPSSATASNEMVVANINSVDFGGATIETTGTGTFDQLEATTVTESEGGTFGAAFVGNWAGNSLYGDKEFAVFCHEDLKSASSSYAFIQRDSGEVYFNAPSGKDINFMISGTAAGKIDSSGNLDMLDGNITTTGDVTIDSDTNGLILGADQDMLVSSDAPGDINFTSAANTDITATFIGTTHSGQFMWMEDEDYFEFLDTVVMDSDTYWSGDGSGLPFADISVYNNGTADTVATATWAQMTRFDTNGENNNCTPDHTNDHITITKAGRYMVTVSASFSGDPNITWYGGVWKNNGATQLQNIQIHRKLGAGGDVGCVSMSGIGDFAANDTIEIWIRQDSGADKAITVVDCCLAVSQVGGT